MALSEKKIDMAMKNSTIAMTKLIMQTSKLCTEDAYRKMIGMEIYKLLRDKDTRLYLEPNKYLCECCYIELSQGVKALYQFINK